jgi:hypothetical protein
MLNQENCATRNHIEVGDNRKLPTGRKEVSFSGVARGSLFGVAVWVTVSASLGFLFSWVATVIAIAVFSIIFSATFIYRIVKGHTLRCGLLGALAAPLRLVDMF